MMQRSTTIVASLLALPAFLFAAPAMAQGQSEAPPHPRPAIVSPSWNLDFEYQKPQAIAIQDLTGAYRWYWYMPYTVTNNSGSEQLFIPEVTVFTDRGDIITAGDKVPAVVFQAIRERMNNPLLESPVEIVGRILQGEDYARQSVAIWPAFPHNVNRMTVFVGGLSGETQITTDPLTGEEVLMRRTLQIDFRTPGNYPNPGQQPVILEGEQEVMR